MSVPLFKRCLMILADGARPDVLADQMAKGNLPNMARYMSATHQTMITVFPSTTGPAYLPYLTGCYPGTCNIPGIRWFDKDHYAEKGWSFKSFRSYVGLENFLFNRDINPNVKTAFEIFDSPINIFSMVNRGVDLKGENLTRFNRIWYLYYAHLTDHWSFVDKKANEKLLWALDNKNPDFMFIVYPSVDEYAHRSSPFHPRTLQAYQEIDQKLGVVIEKLKSKGWLEETLFVLVSDHGLSETKKHFDVGPFLEKKGLKTFFYTQIFKRNFEAASMVSGNGMVHLYFKGAKGWKGRVTFEELSSRFLLLDELRIRPEIALVATTGEGHAIHIQTEKGHGWYKVMDGKIHYRWDSLEPLSLNLPSNHTEKFLELTPDEALKLTWNSHYPDVFEQLTQLFKSPRTGDIVLSANTGFDLREKYEHPEHKGSHGAICPEHMRTPLLMNYPIKKEFIRSVDIFPTVLELMGKKVPEGIDGKSLL